MPFPTPWKDNYAIIAENTTKFYLELKRNYTNRFPDETTLLAAAGVCDAAVYVFGEKTISAEDILGIAHDVVEKHSAPQLRRFEQRMAKFKGGRLGTADFIADTSSSPLVDFIAGLEVKLFQVDSPRLRESDIVDAVVSKYDKIGKVVSKTVDKYKCEPQFAQSVRALMEHADYAGVRGRLRISEV